MVWTIGFGYCGGQDSSGSAPRSRRPDRRLVCDDVPDVRFGSIFPKPFAVFHPPFMEPSSSGPDFGARVRVVGRPVRRLTPGGGPLDDRLVMIAFTRRRHVDLRRVASQACRR
ncbi:putative leader peptide [Saccharopolyspora pogona]|uniref:putative leader peptide n=1 Tax=Saccharopolyspora pogona TaxID=333966 RepID=UPI0016862854|nr:putative leader peptide [Saccharopolyspora pogona]